MLVGAAEPFFLKRDSKGVQQPIATTWRVQLKEQNGKTGLDALAKGKLQPVFHHTLTAYQSYSSFSL